MGKALVPVKIAAPLASFSPLAGISFWESLTIAAVVTWDSSGVSVPLRGLAFGKVANLKRPCLELLHVSVPLRGLAFGKVYLVINTAADYTCFSPLAGISFWERLGLSIVKKAVECFSPLAGISFWESAIANLMSALTGLTQLSQAIASTTRSFGRSLRQDW